MKVESLFIGVTLKVTLIIEVKYIGKALPDVFPC